MKQSLKELLVVALSFVMALVLLDMAKHVGWQHLVSFFIVGSLVYNFIKN